MRHSLFRFSLLPEYRNSTMYVKLFRVSWSYAIVCCLALFMKLKRTPNVNMAHFWQVSGLCSASIMTCTAHTNIFVESFLLYSAVCVQICCISHFAHATEPPIRIQIHSSIWCQVCSSVARWYRFDKRNEQEPTAMIQNCNCYNKNILVVCRVFFLTFFLCFV